MASVTSPARIVFVMAGSEQEAERISRTIVEEGLAACANVIGPVKSIYRWRGAVEEAQEHLILMKTRAALYRKLERRVRELHSYELPEIVTVNIRAGLPAYLAWITDSTIGIAPTQRKMAH